MKARSMAALGALALLINACGGLDPGTEEAPAPAPAAAKVSKKQQATTVDDGRGGSEPDWYHQCGTASVWLYDMPNCSWWETGTLLAWCQLAYGTPTQWCTSQYGAECNQPGAAGAACIEWGNEWRINCWATCWQWV